MAPLVAFGVLPLICIQDPEILLARMVLCRQQENTVANDCFNIVQCPYPSEERRLENRNWGNVRSHYKVIKDKLLESILN